ncbi:hypothetical protein SELMODRAFT_430359 [Selaginella moellendorffii]|uniref:Uncharacterized protein n=1 Tax=Selaginella moellendorffii TaxID=88036 RepID=D8T960_SELML|nr:hypothetical protein SELMODRAFT_430359 [Selaginella moellendorffii]
MRLRGGDDRAATTSIELVDMMRDGKQRRQQQQRQPVAEVPGKEIPQDLVPIPPVTGLARRTYVIFRSARSGPADPSFSSCGAKRIALIFQLLLLVLGLGAGRTHASSSISSIGLCLYLELA